MRRQGKLGEVMEREAKEDRKDAAAIVRHGMVTSRPPYDM